MYFLHDSPTAYSVGWSQSKDEIKAQLRTPQGILKVHKQFYHISAKEMIRFVLPLFENSEHQHIRELITKVIKNCKICRKQAHVSPKPGVQSKGLWPRAVNDIVTCDTFFVENIAILHMLELFSGWSLFFVSEDLDHSPTADMTIDAFYLWLSIFGAAMKIYFCDQGPEFTDIKGGVMDTLRLNRVRVFQSPAQSPFTNPTERHNAIG